MKEVWRQIVVVGGMVYEYPVRAIHHLLSKH